MRYLNIAIFLFSLASQAQVISPNVTNSAGKSIQTSYSGLDFNIGEPITGTVSNGTAKITQGFLQPQICNEPTSAVCDATHDTILVGDSTRISITSGSLNDATQWFWYKDSCGGTAIDSGTAITVHPDSTTSYFVRGEGGCTTPSLCAQVTIHVIPVMIPTLSEWGLICLAGLILCLGFHRIWKS